VGDDDQLIAERYRVIARLGRGGMGVVWLAYDEKLHRKVAVKRLLMPSDLTGPQTDEAVRRTVREGQVAARLQHRNAIALFDVFQDNGQAYLVMEYLPSRSLSQVLAERGTLSPVETAEIGVQVAGALSAAHAAGVVHRDVKPANVLLGDDGTAKITDFGISRAVEDAGSTTSGMLLGTPAYLSPEVAKGERATFASDVFSLGATLFTMIEGIAPAGSSDNTMALLYKIASGEFSAPRNAGPMTAILERMLCPDPRMRPTMTEVRDSLAVVATVPAEPTTPLPPPPRPQPASEGSRKKAGLIMVALAGLAIAAVLLLLVMDRDEPGTPSAAVPSSSATTVPSPTTESVTPPPSTTTTTTSSTTPAAPPAQPLSAVIRDYYALMPGNLQEAWTRLTPKYQRHPAGGRGGYETFWSRVRSIQVSTVNVLSGNTVEAAVQYNFKDGRVIQERHRYVLVLQDGRWLIDQSTVISSRTV
jgi:eukaryotic-like serine/threonine-protein kinase